MRLIITMSLPWSLWLSRWCCHVPAASSQSLEQFCFTVWLHWHADWLCQRSCCWFFLLLPIDLNSYWKQRVKFKIIFYIIKVILQLRNNKSAFLLLDYSQRRFYGQNAAAGFSHIFSSSVLNVSCSSHSVQLAIPDTLFSPLYLLQICPVPPQLTAAASAVFQLTPVVSQSRAAYRP